MIEDDRWALVADIGGSNARFAIADPESLKLARRASLPSASFSSLQEAVKAYLESIPERPSVAGFAVAGPIIGDRLRMTNLPWSITRRELQEACGGAHIALVNDFVALALSLPRLAAEDLHRIGGTDAAAEATRLVLGPGTGLGVAGLVHSDAGWIAVQGEGGHVSLPVSNRRELAIRERMAPGGAHVSAERLVSGPGLVQLHAVLAELEGLPPPGLPGERITTLALEGTDRLAALAMEHFVDWLGRLAGDLALAFGARGGVYLGGGIAPRILPLLENGRFRAAFERKGRLSSFLEAVPVHVIMAGDAGLRGAAIAAARCRNFTRAEDKPA